MNPGDRVIGGIGPDREAGTALEVDGSTAIVAWDQGVRTTAPVDALEPLAPAPSGLGHWRHMRAFHAAGIGGRHG